MTLHLPMLSYFFVQLVPKTPEIVEQSQFSLYDAVMLPFQTFEPVYRFGIVEYANIDSYIPEKRLTYRA